MSAFVHDLVKLLKKKKKKNGHNKQKCWPDNTNFF